MTGAATPVELEPEASADQKAREKAKLEKELGVKLDSQTFRDTFREELERDAARKLVRRHWASQQAAANGDSQAMPGGEWIFKEPEAIPIAWGASDGAVLEAEGEGLLIVGPVGTYKTTLDQRKMLAELGIGGPDVLGLPVKPLAEDQNVLYIAADRPRQQARSLRRMARADEHRRVLDDRLVVWDGPLPFDLATVDPENFLQWIDAQGEGIGSLHIDALKNVASGIADGESAMNIDANFQAAISSGRRLTVVHHNRKATTDNKKPKRIDDIYGSVLIPAGMGGVVLCWGTSGDPVVEVSSLKTPAGEFGPATMKVDTETGEVWTVESVDLVKLVEEAGGEITAKEAARGLFGNDDPDRGEVERARRKLGTTVRLETVPGSKSPIKWRLCRGAENE